MFQHRSKPVSYTHLDVYKRQINGKKEIVSLNIKKEAVDPEDVEILQDMIIGAVNEAIRKVEEIHTTEMEKITNGLSLPGIF